MILKNKVVFITGGSRGLGKQISIEMSKAGAKVFLTYKNQKNFANKVVSEIKSFGGVAKSMAMDVCDRKNVKKTILTCVKHFKKIDILVNNAGINKPNDFDKVKDKDWSEIMDVNLKGVFICSQEALPFLIKNRGGSIVNIGSVSGQYGGPRTPHYAASKAGLISLSQVIARYSAKYNIRCNTLAAGLILSEMAKKSMKSASVKEAAKKIMLGRLGNPKEIASVAVFLASDQSSYITAQTINVNGGLYF